MNEIVCTYINFITVLKDSNYRVVELKTVHPFLQDLTLYNLINDRELYLTKVAEEEIIIDSHYNKKSCCSISDCIIF
jgi:hypothetical protein